MALFIGKTLLEKNNAKVEFKNVKKNKGALVKIVWLNENLKRFIYKKEIKNKNFFLQRDSLSGNFLFVLFEIASSAKFFPLPTEKAMLTIDRVFLNAPALVTIVPIETAGLAMVKPKTRIFFYKHFFIEIFIFFATEA